MKKRKLYNCYTVINAQGNEVFVQRLPEFHYGGFYSIFTAEQNGNSVSRITREKYASAEDAQGELEKLANRNGWSFLQLQY